MAITPYCCHEVIVGKHLVEKNSILQDILADCTAIGNNRKGNSKKFIIMNKKTKKNKRKRLLSNIMLPFTLVIFLKSGLDHINDTKKLTRIWGAICLIIFFTTALGAISQLKEFVKRRRANGGS